MLWIQLFPYRALTDQFGCTCDNDFIIIKMNSGLIMVPGITDHSDVKAQSNLPSQQLTPCSLADLSYQFTQRLFLYWLFPGGSRVSASEFCGAMEIPVCLYYL